MPFKKGQSGNPTGRRRGSPNKLTRTFREAMGLVFDRLGGEKHLLAWAKKYPTEYYRIKARMVPPGHTVNIGRLEGSLADQAKLIATRMAEGAITVEQANSMMGVLATQVRIIEADELERRLRELESKVQASARHG